jgi:hypothetical protein
VVEVEGMGDGFLGIVVSGELRLADGCACPAVPLLGLARGFGELEEKLKMERRR